MFAREYLKKAVTEKTLPHALLLSGDQKTAELFAKEAASSLLEVKDARLEKHPDFISVHPEGKAGVYPIEKIREVIDLVRVAPFEASFRVFFFYHAERMQTASANALLKTLEEPTPHTKIFLLTKFPKALLATLRSRCTALFFPGSFKEEEKELEEMFRHLFSKDLPFHERVPYVEAIEKKLEEKDPVERYQSILFGFRIYLSQQKKEELERAEKKVQEALLAYERNIKGYLMHIGSLPVGV